MNVEFKKSFAKDLKKVKDHKLLDKVREIIEHVEEVESLREIEHLKKP
jgi:mRNA interferase RelE/StbE